MTVAFVPGLRGSLRVPVALSSMGGDLSRLSPAPDVLPLSHVSHNATAWEFGFEHAEADAHTPRGPIVFDIEPGDAPSVASFGEQVLQAEATLVTTIIDFDGSPLTDYIVVGSEDWFRFDPAVGVPILITSTLGSGFFTLHDRFGRVLFSDSVQNDPNWSVTMLPTDAGPYYIAFSTGFLADASNYNFHITTSSDDFPAALNTTGVVVVDGGATHARHDYHNDLDLFRVSIAATGEVWFEAAPAGLYTHNLIALYDANGELITYAFNGAPGQGLNYNFTSPGEYFVGVYSLSDTDDAHAYTITAQTFPSDAGSFFETAGAIALNGGTINAAIDHPGDVDLLSFQANAGENVHVHLTLNGLQLDSVQIYNADGGPLASGVHSGDVYGEIVNTGTYYVYIAGYFSNYSGGYSVSLSSVADDYTHTNPGVLTIDGAVSTGALDFAQDYDTFAVTVAAGETLAFHVSMEDQFGACTITLRDPYTNSTYNTLRQHEPTLYHTFQSAGTYYITIDGVLTDASLNDYTLSAVSVADDIPDNTDTTAVLTVDGAQLSARIEYGVDSDFFAVTVSAGEVIHFVVQPDHVGLQFVDVSMHDTNGLPVGQTTPGVVGFQGVYRFDIAGTYYLEVSSTHSGQAGGYTVSAVSVADDFGSGTATLGALTVGGAAATGHFEYTEDSDWFAVNLQAGATYDFAVSNAGAGFFAAHIDVYDQNGDPVAAFPGSAFSPTTFTADHTGLYYLAAVNHGSTPGTTYNISATPNLDLASAIATGTASPFDSVFGHMHVGDSHVIHVYFAASGEGFNGQVSNGWSQADIDAVMNVLSTFENYINVDFQQTTTLAIADITLLTFDDPNTLTTFARENADVPIPVIGFSTTTPVWTASGLALGGLGAATVLNGVGYALGLALPHIQDGHSTVMHGVTSEFDLGDFGLNQGVYTIMSFNDGWTGQGGAQIGYGWQATPMAIDVAVLQGMYGANTIFHNSNTTYTLGDVNAPSTSWQSIWDTGGLDAIVYGGSANATIDLRAATLLYENGGGGFLSYVEGVSGGFGIDRGVIIEQAIGGSGADNLTGNGAVNTLVGNAGADTLDGGAGADTMIGGDGDDTYVVDNAGDVTSETSPSGGIDTVQSSITRTLGANLENLILVGSGATNGFGNALNNVITGNSAANQLNGFDGADTLDGGAGADSMFGGNGDDTYIVDNTGDLTTEVSALGGIDTVMSSVARNLIANIENLTLMGSASIIGAGNSLNNVIIGNSGANTLYGFDGNDTVDGGAGADTLFGAAGDDTYYVDVVGDITVEGIAGPAGGIDTVISSISRNLNANFENMILVGGATIAYGNVLNNVLTGNALANSLYGFDGNDTLDGAGGADQMFGGNGDDVYIVDNAGDVTSEVSALGGVDTVLSSVTRNLTANLENLVLTGAAAINGAGNVLDNVITGNSAANTLFGLDGADTLDGGLGADTLQGGTGADTYMFSSAIGGGNIDTIVGFSVVDDTIRLNSSVFAGLAVGVLDAAAFVVGSAAGDADDRIIYDGAIGALYFDVDGAGGADQVQFATLAAGLGLTSADFVIGGP